MLILKAVRENSVCQISFSCNVQKEKKKLCIMYAFSECMSSLKVMVHSVSEIT